MSNEISTFQQSRSKLNMLTLLKGRNFVPHCCQKRRQSTLSKQSFDFCIIQQCCFDVVAGVDGALPTKFSQPPNLHNLISVHRPRSRPTRSSSVVSLARPPTSTSLKITDRSFVRPVLHNISGWNQLPLSLRQPHSHTSSCFRLTYFFTHHFFLFCFITLLIHNSPSLPLLA